MTSRKLTVLLIFSLYYVYIFDFVILTHSEIKLIKKKKEGRDEITNAATEPLTENIFPSCLISRCVKRPARNLARDPFLLI